MSSFYTDLERGAKGERAVMQAMLDRGHTVEDLTNNSNYYEDDIDFIIAGKTVELKTDYIINRTNNLFLEKKLIYKNGKEAEGYYSKSKAEYLFYLDALGGDLYIYKFEDVREYVENNVVITRTCNDGYKKVQGYCVNKNAIQHQEVKIEWH